MPVVRRERPVHNAGMQDWRCIHGKVTLAHSALCDAILSIENQDYLARMTKAVGDGGQLLAKGISARRRGPW
ncbi:hypothetical protein RHIZ404_210475 [Rhizobium sp. EC-SD404]|nr:hypothetical protein RHIZ404_210475 [Rhizobium sp. EC-SD404]